MKHTHTTWRGALIGLVAAGLILRLAFALLPLQHHLLLLEDDAWMVTAIARNWALGRGITADGVNPTNGFHPLYTLTLGAVPYLVAPNDLDAGFTASLVMCALLATLAIWPLWLVTRRLAGERAALIAVALYALNPLVVRLTVNGMETAMALLLWLTTVWATLRLDLRTVRGNLWLAIITGLMILTRLDGALLFAAIGLARLLWAWRDGRLRHELPLLTLYVVGTFIILVPYFWRNYAVFGSLSPSSGKALTYLHSYVNDFSLTNGLQAFYLNNVVPLDWLPSAWLLLLLLAIATIVVWRVIRRELWRALPLVIYIVIPPLYYGYLMQQSNRRYFVPFSIVLTIGLAWVLAQWWERRSHRWVHRAIVGTVVAIIALQTATTVQFWRHQRTMPQLTQPTMYEAALWMRDNLPSDAIIGAKNSGIFQYYSGHTVINIDGKLNHEILAAYRQRSLLDYLYAKNITYLVDREVTLADHIQFYSTEFGPAPQHTVPTPLQRIRIYGQLLLNKLGLGDPPQLDRRDGFVPNRPFSEFVTVLKTFPRPNEATNPIVVLHLNPRQGATQ